MRRNDKFSVAIEKHIGTISRSGNGWTMEVNMVRWNEAPATACSTTAVIDIREWDASHEHMSFGVRLKEEEAKKLLEILQEYFQKG